MIDTNIQWADDTVNPNPGCDGCELWPTISQIHNGLLRSLAGQLPAHPVAEIKRSIHNHIQSETLPSTVYKERLKVVTAILTDLGLCNDNAVTKAGVEAVEKGFRCYAGHLTVRYGGHSKGYPARFEKVAFFPGRMAKAAKQNDLCGTPRPHKLWLNELPRQIFVSDMGDSLSRAVPFDYLRQEIIDVVASHDGQRHNWLWLTKRPQRMVQFLEWLCAKGIEWPSNLVPMTSITSQQTTVRCRILAAMGVPLKGLSVEPLLERIRLPLVGIDWVIVGGESGKYANPFHLEWARDLQHDCAERGIAFFMKQLGQNPFENGQPLKLEDLHGGDWDEWPEDLRVREFPAGFYRHDKAPVMQPQAVAG